MCWAAIVLLSGFLCSCVFAASTCHTAYADAYPYCVYVPNNLPPGQKLPTILFLSGSGARNNGSDIRSLYLPSRVCIIDLSSAAYDGFGSLVFGNHSTPAARFARKHFVVIVPISPMFTSNRSIVRHWWPTPLLRVIQHVEKRVKAADMSRLHCAGYSMGSRGCWRFSQYAPRLLLSTANVAGAAENSKDESIRQQKASPTYPHLKKIRNLPAWIVAGTNDDTAGLDRPKQTYLKLKRLGDLKARLRVVPGATHQNLDVSPFNIPMMKWMLSQSRKTTRLTLKSTKNPRRSLVDSAEIPDSKSVFGEEPLELLKPAMTKKTKKLGK